MKEGEPSEMALLVQFLSCMQVLTSVHDTSWTNPVWWHRPVTLALARGKQQGQMIKVIFNYIATLVQPGLHESLPQILPSLPVDLKKAPV